MPNSTTYAIMWWALVDSVAGEIRVVDYWEERVVTGGSARLGRQTFMEYLPQLVM